MLQWDDPNKRFFAQGLDRGVLYIPGLDPIPWNGLMTFDEGDSPSAPTILYRDGVIYLADVDASDFSGNLTAMYYPDEFGVCLGIPQVTDGLFVDNQKPKRFGLSYRTLVGNGTSGDMFGYQIHLVYNCMASIGVRARASIGPNTTPTEFSFNIVCTPMKLPGYRPTAHYVIDTRNMSASKVAELEALLYGSGVTPGSLPDPEVIFDLLNYGDAIVVRVHGDGTYTVEGSSENVFSTGPHSFMMKNINGTDNGDGTYVISDGGNTDVIIE
jgi:hypothetical protein